MKRLPTGLFACVVLVAQTTLAQTPTELDETSRFVESLQNPDGGFAGKLGGTSTLGTTSSAIRILKNTGGSIPYVLATIKYAKSCVDAASGGFAQTPGGKPDVGTTASGLMAVAELKIADESMVSAALKYLSENAKTYEEIRIGVAGLEAVSKTSPDFANWKLEILKGRNDDGTFGEGPGKARETGGKAVALLRMGVDLDKKDTILSFLKSAQNADGAWSKSAGGSELESTYRIMRAFFMLKERPDVDKLKDFIGNCRHSDGSYSPQPGVEGNLGGTYFATTVLRWVRILQGEPELVETAGFRSLFNGTDLTGWEGDTTLWSAHRGMLTGVSEGLKHNDFLATNQSYDDFVLKLSFKLGGGEGNSGVQFRSVRVPGHEMSGYQADIGQNYWGCLYDESRRNKVLEPAQPNALKSLRKEDWNQYVIDAKGDDIRLALNGVPSVRYQETDSTISRDGKFGLQMHAGGPMAVKFKDIYVQPIPKPRAGDDLSAGFHLRSLKAGEDHRKYTLYIPTTYNGNKALPVVLFLHGSGERGEDGVKSAQVGLGPAIHNNPKSFHAIAIFPQAKTTWAADSADAKAALAALDEVVEMFDANKNRIVITGLSMGGAGAWSIAAANPGRFAGVAPICGRGKIESAKVLATLPTWAFCGDADSAATVLNTRAMVEALTSGGGKAQLTEYRAVGHNSWDRAYNNPGLVDWMLSQVKK